jgi:hypothetical protein
LGEGGVGVLVGGGGRIGYDESAMEKSGGISSKSWLPLDDVSEDSDDAEERKGELISNDAASVSRVIVSAREREAKRP